MFVIFLNIKVILNDIQNTNRPQINRCFFSVCLKLSFASIIFFFWQFITKYNLDLGAFKQHNTQHPSPDIVIMNIFDWAQLPPVGEWHLILENQHIYTYKYINTLHDEWFMTQELCRIIKNVKKSSSSTVGEN